MKDCIFCKIVAGEMPSTKLFENDHVLAFLDIYPGAQGHSLVIPKKHYVNLIDVPEKELQEVIKIVKKIGVAQVNGLGAHGFNVHQSNNKEAGQVVFHLHFHVLPRKENDGLGFRWNPQKANPEELKITQEKIIKALK